MGGEHGYDVAGTESDTTVALHHLQSQPSCTHEPCSQKSTTALSKSGTDRAKFQNAQSLAVIPSRVAVIVSPYVKFTEPEPEPKPTSLVPSRFLSVNLRI